MTIKFQLRKAYSLRIHHHKCLGISKEDLVNELSKTYLGMIIVRETNKEEKDDGCDSHLQGIIQGEKLNPKTVIQKRWPKCRGNKFIAAPLMEKGILEYMAYLLKEDLKPTILNVSKAQLKKARLYAFKENKNGEMKLEIKKAKLEWLSTKPQGACTSTWCIDGTHRRCCIEHTRFLYDKVATIYDKYGKDLPQSNQIRICRPSCKRMYPSLLRRASDRANRSMWGEYD